MVTQPVTRKGNQTRKTILSAGRAVFARDGYVAARMSDVVQASTLSTGAVYRYFKDKEDLFAAVIGDLHEELYQSTRAVEHDFRTEPFEALLEANHSYLMHYYKNRHLLRAFREAATINPRFGAISRRMRRRHVDRFVANMRRLHSVFEDDGIHAELAAEAMACMVEQSAYVWYSQEEPDRPPVAIEDAAQVVTRAWYRTFFG